MVTSYANEQKCKQWRHDESANSDTHAYVTFWYLCAIRIELVHVKILLFYSSKTGITKTMFVNTDVSSKE